MKIAVIDPSLFTLPYDLALCDGLHQKGYDVVLVGRQPRAGEVVPGSTRFVRLFYNLSERDFVRSLPNPSRLLIKGVDHIVSMIFLFFYLFWLVPDVIHFQWLPMPLVDGLLLRLLRPLGTLVMTVHDTDPFNGNPSSRFQTRGFFSALKMFKILIVHTQQGKARLADRGLQQQRIAVIPHGLLYPRPVYQYERFDDEITFLLFGRIKKYKGLDLLVEAFGRLTTSQQQSSRLCVVGEAFMDLDPIVARVRDLNLLDRVTMHLGFVSDDDIETWFSGAAICMFPYREIEASGVLTIALSYGRPIIATRIGSFDEVLTDGLQGHLVQTNDVGGLSRAMAHMIEDRSFTARCGWEARKTLDDIPSWAEIGALTARSYRI